MPKRRTMRLKIKKPFLDRRPGGGDAGKTSGTNRSTRKAGMNDHEKGLRLLPPKRDEGRNTRGFLRKACRGRIEIGKIPGGGGGETRLRAHLE